jgi:hypothetical protein
MRIAAVLFVMLCCCCTAEAGRFSDNSRRRSPGRSSNYGRRFALPPGCCKWCRKGKACGDSCISQYNWCNTFGGCACNEGGGGSDNDGAAVVAAPFLLLLLTACGTIIFFDCSPARLGQFVSTSASWLLCRNAFAKLYRYCQRYCQLNPNNTIATAILITTVSLVSVKSTVIVIVAIIATAIATGSVSPMDVWDFVDNEYKPSSSQDNESDSDSDTDSENDDGAIHGTGSAFDYNSDSNDFNDYHDDGHGDDGNYQLSSNCTAAARPTATADWLNSLGEESIDNIMFNSRRHGV